MARTQCCAHWFKHNFLQVAGYPVKQLILLSGRGQPLINGMSAHIERTLPCLSSLKGRTSSSLKQDKLSIKTKHEKLQGGIIIIYVTLIKHVLLHIAQKHIHVLILTLHRHQK